MLGDGKPQSGAAGGSKPGHGTLNGGSLPAAKNAPRESSCPGLGKSWVTLQMGCPCTSRDPTAGTGLGIQLPLLIPWCWTVSGFALKSVKTNLDCIGRAAMSQSW